VKHTSMCEAMTRTLASHGPQDEETYMGTFVTSISAA
jgi:hypothetical protein